VAAGIPPAVIFMLHDAPSGAVIKALARVGKLPVVKGKPVLIRIEDFKSSFAVLIREARNAASSIASSQP
jgi:hypothetical protein